MSQRKEDELFHEALQSRKVVANYLRSIADGLDSGMLRLTGDHLELELHPQDLVGFELRAKREPGRTKVRIRLAWREDPPAVTTDPVPLSIASS